MAYVNPANVRDAMLKVKPSGAINFLSEQDLVAALFLTSADRSR